MRTATALWSAVLCLALAAAPVLAQQGEAPDEMEEANRAAAMLLTERLKRDRPGDYRAFCRLRPADVLVVSGAYDHLEDVLRELGIRHHRTTPEALARLSLRGYRAVLVNCPGRVGEDGARRLAAFVSDGGHLLTTDWAVLHVIEEAFPGTLRYNRRPTRDDVVAIRGCRPGDPLLRQVLTGRHRHLWWLESHSYPFEVLDRRRVRVLIDSEEMERKYGAGAIAARFPWGRGTVVHIVSHAYLQRTELRTEADRRGAREFAEDLGFPPDSPAAGRLKEAGLGGVPAGKLRSAYSAQQFLVNLLVAAAPPAGEEPPVEPPRVDLPRPRPAPSGPRVRLPADGTLRDGPDGTKVRAVPAGLLLTIVETRSGWVKVRTPAGVTGWLPRDAVR